MKLLWLSHLIPYPPKGGVLQRSYNLLREVSKYHDVYLIAFVQGDLVKTTLRDLDKGKKEAAQVLGSFCKRVQFIEIPCEHKPFGKHWLAFKSLFTRNPYTINWLESEKMHCVVKDWQDEISFDVVHFDTISIAPYLGYFPHAKTVLDHHNIESHMLIRRAAMEKNWLKKFYFIQEGIKLKRYEKDICPQFNMHVTCSQLDSERLLEIDENLIVDEIPNGVDVKYFSPMNEKELPMSLVFAGGLKWYPNQKAMLYFAKEVWPLLKLAIPTINIDVIGQSPPVLLLDIAARDASYRVHGFVDDVRPYLDRAAVYVCPISDGGGTKLKILDALAMGKAIVADPIACEGIGVTDGENVLFASSPRDYVEKIQFLLENSQVRREMGESARRLVLQDYAYTSIGMKLAQIYERI